LPITAAIAAQQVQGREQRVDLPRAQAPRRDHRAQRIPLDVVATVKVHGAGLFGPRLADQGRQTIQAAQAGLLQQRVMGEQAALAANEMDARRFGAHSLVLKLNAANRLGVGQR
jgi:hypothetical protein